MNRLHYAPLEQSGPSRWMPLAAVAVACALGVVVGLVVSSPAEATSLYTATTTAPSMTATASVLPRAPMQYAQQAAVGASTYEAAEVEQFAVPTFQAEQVPASVVCVRHSAPPCLRVFARYAGLRWCLFCVGGFAPPCPRVTPLRWCPFEGTTSARIFCPMFFGQQANVTSSSRYASQFVQPCKRAKLYPQRVRNQVFRRATDQWDRIFFGLLLRYYLPLSATGVCNRFLIHPHISFYRMSAVWLAFCSSP